MNDMNTRNLWSKILTVAGGIAVAFGGIDPLMVGWILVIPGGPLLVLGAWLGQAERRAIACKVWASILIAVGYALIPIWYGVMMANVFGRMGSTSGPSISTCWGLPAFLPLVIGWNMLIWGPGSPRWLSLLGIGDGLWYLAMLGVILARQDHGDWPTLVALAIFGIVVLVGCTYRVRQQMKAKAVVHH